MTKTPRLQTILFDMGNVLVTFSHERMCRQIADVCHLSAVDVKCLLFDSALQWDFERGLVTEAEIHGRLEQATGRRIDLATLAHAASDIFELNARLVPVLDELRAKGFRLVLLSNTSVLHFRHVREHFDVLAGFDEFVLSYRVGALKPQPAMYEAALQAIGCAPENCFYTDDIEAYVVAGRRHGLQAEVFTTPEALVAQLRERGVTLDAPAH